MEDRTTDEIEYEKNKESLTFKPKMETKNYRVLSSEKSSTEKSERKNHGEEKLSSDKKMPWMFDFEADKRLQEKQMKECNSSGRKS